MQFTNSKPDTQELHKIIKNMRSNASLGPDGLSAAFYKAAWNWIAQDVTQLVTHFYTTASLQHPLNHTFITLVPKKMQPTLPQDFRPISLCNVIYKLIAKTLADRLKPHLPNYIDHSQAAFIESRHISSNIIITQELVHSFSLKSWKDHAFIIKLDLAKAFDRMEWTFIESALTHIDLNDHFIRLIKVCISTSTLSVLVNGEPTDSISPTRGIRQGCPLSPYLFVVAINELSIRLNQAMSDAAITGVSLGPGCPPIHSLLFADDLILYGKATTEEATNIHNILQNFYSQSGQTPNLQKSSILFNKNVSASIKAQIIHIFPVSDLLPNTIHLGHPIIFNHRDRNKAYDFIKREFIAKLTTVTANKLNHAGRLTYIKSVLASIPIYYMSTVLFSKAFVGQITAIIRRFWWTGVQDDNPTTPIPYRSWDDICQPKENGGLGVRDLHTVNKSLLIHAAWNVATNKNPMLSAILKAKYHPNSSFWTARNPASKSVFWSSILQVKQELINNCTLQIHSGNSSIWSTPWCPVWENIHDHINLPVTQLPLPAIVSQVWDHDSCNWNVNYIAFIFDSQAV